MEEVSTVAPEDTEPVLRRARARKAISSGWDRMQSAWLVGVMILVLTASIGLGIFTVVGMTGPPRWFLWSLGVSAGFAGLVWRLRASTGPAATLGAAICLQALVKQGGGEPWTRTAMPELVALFVLTFAATRFGRRRGHGFADAQEVRRGRSAAQVMANLGFAGIWLASPENSLFVASLAALAEATADTVSSEMGQALGGRTVMLTTLRRVAPGTDGGISLAGTALGVGAAAVLAGLPVILGAIDWTSGLAVFVAGCGGLAFDSLLGATVERWGWIGNDLVNFASTVFAGVIAYQALHLLAPPMPYW